VDNCLYVPTNIPLAGTATRVAVGSDQVCVLLTTGAVYCWGDNSRGQLGRPGAASLVPVAVNGGFTFTALSAGSEHSCAIEAGSGAIGCWGANDTGQLGDGTTTDRDHPVPVVAAE
jgi:alpha-tubulin suppressor-like RCC1 family protein